MHILTRTKLRGNIKPNTASDIFKFGSWFQISRSFHTETQGDLQIRDAPACAPTCRSLNIPDELNHDLVLDWVAHKVTGQPKGLNSIVQTALVGICLRDATYALGVVDLRADLTVRKIALFG